MTSFPKVSIVTPSFNQGQYIEKTIQSILTQDYDNIEYIIMDGGSTDGSVDIIRRYEDQISLWRSESDGGQTDALRKGFDVATGEFLMWVNSDDYLLPGALTKLVNAYRQSPAVDVVTGLGGRVDSSGALKKWDHPIGEVDLQFLFSWMSGVCFCQPSTMFSKTSWDTCGPFDQNFSFAFDLDFWIKVKKAGFEYAVINDYLSMETHHPNQKTAAFRQHTKLEMAIIITKHGGQENVRTYLNNLVDKLEYYETLQRRSMRNRVFNLVRRLRRRRRVTVKG